MNCARGCSPCRRCIGARRLFDHSSGFSTVHHNRRVGETHVGDTYIVKLVPIFRIRERSMSEFVLMILVSAAAGCGPARARFEVKVDKRYTGRFSVSRSTTLQVDHGIRMLTFPGRVAPCA